MGTRSLQPLVTAALLLCLTLAAPLVVPGSSKEPGYRNRVVPGESSPSLVFEKGGRALGIPFQLYRNHIFLQASVNNSRLLWFLLDTGASFSIVSAERARELNLKVGDDIEFSAVGGKARGAAILGASIKLPGVRMEAQTLAALPLAAVEPQAGRSIDGLLGGDFFSRAVVEIDYANRSIGLYEPGQYVYSGPGDVVPFTLQAMTPFVRAALTQSGRDPITGTFEIDTGAGRTLELASPFIKEKGLLAGTQRTIPAPSGAQVGGLIHQRVGRLEELQLGRYAVRGPIAGFSQDDTGELARNNYAGMIGGEFLRRFKVIFDYSRLQVILEPNSAISQPDESDMSGIDVVSSGADFRTFVVRSVLPGSPAAQAGVVAGDRILSIDNKPATTLTLEEVEHSFRQRGRRLLKLSRGNQTFDLQLTLKRII